MMGKKREENTDKTPKTIIKQCKVIKAKPIKTSDISVIIQGAIDLKMTTICLKSVRQNIPDGEIILSTWKNTDAKVLQELQELNEKEKLFNILLLHDEVNAVKSKFYHGKGTGFNNNIFKMILSSREGLKKATRKYALKMRTDMEMKNLNFIDYFGKFDDHETDEKKIVKNRLVISSVYTCKVFDYKDNSFRFSDWFHFGLREDVLKLWDIPFENDPCYTGKKARKTTTKELENMLIPADSFHEEQYLWGNFAKANGIKFEMLDENDFSETTAKLSEEFLIKNAVIVDFAKSGFEMLKIGRRFYSYGGLYCHYDWLRLYKQYCNPNIQLPNCFFARCEIAFYSTKNAYARHAIRICKAVDRCRLALQENKNTHYYFEACVAILLMMLKVIYEVLSVLFYLVKFAIMYFIFLAVKYYFEFKS